jgi:hypothetical protein
MIPQRVTPHTGTVRPSVEKVLRAGSSVRATRILPQEGPGSHHTGCLDDRIDYELDAVSEGVSPGLAQRQAENTAVHELDHRFQRARMVKTYRSIEDVFLPLQEDAEVSQDTFRCTKQEHGGPPEASASWRPALDSHHTYQHSTSSEDEATKQCINDIEQMMYVSGETAEPSAETTGMIEEIVRQQVVEIVSTTAPFPSGTSRI